MGIQRFAPPVVMRPGSLEDVDRTNRSFGEKIRELQTVPIVAGKLIKDVELENGAETAIGHGLGRRAVVFCSPPRGASSTGRIEEIRSGSYEPSRVLALKATGWGATITVDLWVF